MDYRKRLGLMVGGLVGLALGGALVWWQAAPRQVVGPVEITRSGEGELRFLVVGDTGTGGDAQMMVAARMESRCREGVKPAGILLLGDNFYQDGVASIEDPQWDEKMWRAYGGECLKEIPLFAVLGNHDYKSNPGAQIEQSAKIPRWRMPARNYAIRFGDLIDIVVFDSNTVDRCFVPSLCTMDFLESHIGQQFKGDQLNGQQPNADAARGPQVPSDRRWRMVMAHHPIVSASAKHTDEKNEVYRHRLRGIVCSGADVMLSGHSHHMEHARLPDCETEFVIAGGGGADLYQVIPNKPLSRFARSTHGFADIRVNQDSLNFTFVDGAGQDIYSFAKHRP